MKITLTAKIIYSDDFHNDPGEEGSNPLTWRSMIEDMNNGKVRVVSAVNNLFDREFNPVIELERKDES